MNAADILAAHGIPRAAEVVELAAAARLELAAAAVLLIKESGGGRNVWGHDAVPTGGCYDKGSEVSRGAYLAYLRAVADGRAGRQGVGPTQLTYGPLQILADKRGGCWDWRVNCLVGFEHLEDLIHQFGERDGFRRYNGSGPPAQRYADDAMTKLKQWRAWLGSTPQEDDVTLDEADVQRIADAVVNRLLVNAFGDTVALQQIITATEGRVAAAQNQLSALVDRLGG